MSNKTLLEKNYILIRKYPKATLLLPTILGGFWQLLALSTISPEYIRFFSVSQLVADGLLMIFILSFYVIGITLCNQIYSFISKLFRFKKIKGRKRRVLRVTLYFVVSFLLLVPGIIDELSNDVSSDTEQDLTILYIATLIFMMIMFPILYLLGDILFFNLIKREKNNSSKSGQKKKFLLLNPAVFVAIIFSLYLVSFLFQPFLYTPESFVNSEYIECKLLKRYATKNVQHEVVYFNDQYIFVETTNFEDNEITEIEVFKFDDLFNRASCDQNL